MCGPVSLIKGNGYDDEAKGRAAVQLPALPPGNIREQQEKRKVSASVSKVEGLPKHCKRAVGQKAFSSYSDLRRN